MKNKRGITLIALIVTIIVLLILAGITINLVVGDNGILNQSKISAKKTNEKAAQEVIEMALTSLNTEFLAEVWSNDVNAKIENWATRGKLKKLVNDSGYELRVNGTNVTLNAVEYLKNDDTISINKIGSQNFYSYNLNVTDHVLSISSVQSVNEGIIVNNNDNTISNTVTNNTSNIVSNTVTNNTSNIVSNIVTNNTTNNISNTVIDTNSEQNHEKIINYNNCFDNDLITTLEKMNSILQFGELIDSKSLDILFPTVQSDDDNIIVSSEYNALPAWNAFSDNDERYNSGDTNEWPSIGYDFGENNDLVMKKLYIKNYDKDSTAVQLFKIQYKNSINDEWSDINQQAIEIEEGEELFVDINQNINARYWQIQILSNYGYANNNCSLYRLGFMGYSNNLVTPFNYFDNDLENKIVQDIVNKKHEPIKLSEIIKCNSFLDKIFESEEALEYIISLSYIQEYMLNCEYFQNKMSRNPVMEGISLPSGNITCSSYYYEPIRAFDNSLASGWIPASNENIHNTFIQYEYENDFKPFICKIVFGAEGTNIPWGFTYKIQGSNDNVHFEDLCNERTVESVGSDIFLCTKHTIYKYYRLVYCTENFVAHSANKYSVWINEFRILGFKIENGHIQKEN